MTDLEIATYIVTEFERGTFTNDPADAGGETRWGITRPYLADYLRLPVEQVSPSMIRNLTRERAIEALIEVEFERRPLLKMLDWRPRLATVDFNFNAGADDGIPALQLAVGAVVDSKLGPKTIAAALAADPLTTAVLVTAERIHFHVERSTRGKPCDTCRLPSQKRFLGGWSDRCSKILTKVAA